MPCDLSLCVADLRQHGQEDKGDGAGDCVGRTGGAYPAETAKLDRGTGMGGGVAARPFKAAASLILRWYALDLAKYILPHPFTVLQD